MVVVGVSAGSAASVVFNAEFQLHAAADNTTLILPLSGVDLRENVFLDGRPVFPVPLPAPQQGYSVPVAGIVNVV